MAKCVLIVDDDKMLRDTLAGGLRKADFDTLTADSAEYADNVLSKVSVDAIVLDRMMGSTDGLTFLKNMRAKGNNTPVIMLTAMSGAENAIDGLANGANDYMAKPFKLQELILRLNNVIKNNKKQSASIDFCGLVFQDDIFFVSGPDGSQKALNLSNEEKKLLQNLLNPIGNTVSATPMVVKRLRNKINSVLSGIDIITVRGTGYKIIKTKQ